MEMKRPLVTILTPGYNVEFKMDRLMQSVLKQSYRPIEFIFVNDGSTDNTEIKFFSYKEKFEKAKILTKYIYQENKGVSGAINTGLKLVTGEFLTWPDSDDFLTNDSIKKKVEFLLKNKSIAVVTTDANMYNDDNLEEPFSLLFKHYPRIVEDDQFELFLNEKSIFCPGCHMVRVDLLKKVMPDMEIYESRLGQNWQMLLPLYYRYKHGFIDEPLFNYIVYPDSISHSNNIRTKDKIFKMKEKERILLSTLKKISMPKGKYFKYVLSVKKRFFLERISILKEISNIFM